MSSLKLAVVCRLIVFFTAVLSSESPDSEHGEAAELGIQLPDTLTEDYSMLQANALQAPSLRGAGVAAKMTVVADSSVDSNHDKSAGARTEEISYMADVQDTSEVSKKEQIAKFTLQEARLEAAQATADQVAAEAMATEELRRADKAAARAKVAWVKLRKAEEAAISLSSGFEAVQSQRSRLSLMSGASSDVPAVVPGIGAGALATPGTPFSVSNSSTSTDSGGCDTSSKVSCPVQTVLTFNFQVPLVSGSVEWAGLALLWLGSLYLASSMCDCGSSLFCLCQLISCGGIGFLAVGTAGSFLKHA